jgi:hypothetical protein
MMMHRESIIIIIFNSYFLLTIFKFEAIEKLLKYKIIPYCNCYQI